MKIINVEDFFHPDAGYQINILAKYMARKGYKVYIITAQLDNLPEYLTSFFGRENIEERDREYENKYHVKIIRIPAIMYTNGRAIFGRSLTSIIKRVNPDIVYAHGNDTISGMRLIYYCLWKKIPIISDSHMLEVASRNKLKNVFRFVYKKTIAKTIAKYQIHVIRTQDDDYTIKHLGVPKNLCPFISFGSDLLLFHPDKNVKKSMREKYGIGNQGFVVLYAGKLDEYKGGLLLANAIRDRICTEKEVTFVIVGNTVGEYGNEVERVFSESENRILRFKTQVYTSLAQYYQMSDIALFPKQCSLSFYDVQACGLPVILEKNTLNETRLNYQNGLSFEADNPNELHKTIETFINMEKEKLDEYINNSINFVVDNYNYENICDEYVDLIEKEYVKQSKRL